MKQCRAHEAWSKRTTQFFRPIAVCIIATALLSGGAFGQAATIVDPHQSLGQWNPDQALEEEQRKFSELVYDVDKLRDEHVLSFPLTTDEHDRMADDPECEDCDEANVLMPLGVNIETDIPIDFRGVRLDNLDVIGRTESFGLMRLVDDGRLVWTSAVHSDYAGALRMRFADVELAESMEMYVYTREQEVYGPYTYRDINESGDIWTNIISGELSFIELRTAGPGTQADLDATAFRLVDVAHLSDDLLEQAAQAAFAKKASYTSPVSSECYDSKTWSIIDYVNKGIGFMAFKKNKKWTYCSGGLLNTINDDETPYFLTANHCLNTKAQAESVITIWRFNTACNGTSYRAHSWQEIWKLKLPRSVGAKLLKTGTDTDFTFIKLSQKPPAGSWFLGWDARTDYSAVNDTKTYRLSHPAYKPMSFSSHSVIKPGVVGSGRPVGKYIYSSNVIGLTQGGSSGSPLMLVTGHVIGQLYGGVCNLSGWDTKKKECKAGWENNSSTESAIDGSFFHTFPHISSYLSPSTSTTPPNRVGCTSSTIAPPSGNDFTDGSGGFAMMIGVMLTGYLALRFGGRITPAGVAKTV